MGIRHYTDMGKWEKKSMYSEHFAPESRRGQNVAHRMAVSELAIAAAARLTAEKESWNSDELV